MKNKVIKIVIQALKTINSTRFFKTERGFQGRFACSLYQIFDEMKIFPDDAIIEQEYQKRLPDHGTTQRPDLIIHVPFEAGHSRNRWEDNFVVFAFKKNAGKEEAQEDFEKLNIMFEKLRYPIGFFININGYPNIYLNKYIGEFKDRIQEFSIKAEEGKVLIRHAWFKDGNLSVEDIG
jgi:hypothetical protein